MTANLGSNTVESSTTEMIRKPVSKTSEHRRITKPIMEKKRRARINNSLNELKVLILDALNKDPSRHSKLEKADILEMTVRHLQKLQRQQVAATIVNDASVLNKYRAGFSECANEVGRYMNNMDGFDQPIRQRILSHLNHCVNSLNQMTANAQFNMQGQKTAFPGMMPPATNNNNNSNALHVHIPLHSGANIFGSNASYAMNGTHDINNNRTYTSPDELKPTLSTPPSSASSTSSHFAFNLQSPKTTIGPISLTTNDIFFRSKNHQHYPHQPNHHFHSSSLSPGSCSFSSEQLSPMGSDGGDFEMAVDCTISKPRSSSSSSSSSSASSTDDNVWRPW